MRRRPFVVPLAIVLTLGWHVSVVAQAEESLPEVYLSPAPANEAPEASEPEARDPGDRDDVFTRADPGVDDREVVRWAVEALEARPSTAPRPPPAYAYRRPPPAAEVAPSALVLDTSDRDLERVMAELGLGALGAALGVGLTALLLVGVSDLGGDEPTYVAAAGGVLVTAFAVTGGVTLGGDLADGRGNFGEAFIGQFVGALVALPLVVLGLAEDAPSLSIAAAITLPVAGAMIGYEIGHATYGGGGSVASRALPLRAAIAPLRDGGVLVVVGGEAL